MRRAVDQLIELIQFAGVAVAFVGVVVTVVRAAMASLASGRRNRITDIGFDLARLATVAGLRIGLTLLIAFEDAYRTDTAGRPGSAARPWAGGLGRARDPRPNPSVVAADRPAENLWPDRARLGRDRRRTAG
jgi:hypothetical protein